MAALSSGSHGAAVYFVMPLSRARLASSLMNVGVSKSGSPAPKPTTSTPAFFIALALAVTASVIESATRATRSARGITGKTPWEIGRILGRGTVSKGSGGCKRRECYWLLVTGYSRPVYDRKGPASNQ